MPQVPPKVLDLCRPDIKSLPIYNAGISESAAQAKYTLARVTKLASNENPFGASPAALDALRQSVGQMCRYPDPECTALREEIHGRTGVPAARILFGNGSENIIELLCQALLAPGDRVVTLAPSFGLHEIFPLKMGATVDKVPVNRALQHDLAAWRSALFRPAKLIMFSTPSNPIGCALGTAQLQDLVDAAPPDAVLVVDEAYHEYAGTGHADTLQVLGAQHRPWMVLRTLSKAYGLAALRIGYGMASDADFVSILHKVRTPFNVNHAAQVAALAALKDTDHLRAVVSATVRERGRLLERLRNLDGECGYDLRLTASQANFLLMDTSRPSHEVAEAMMRRGVIVKPWLEPGFDTFIRVTVGPSADNEHFIGAFKEAMTEIRAG